MTGNVADLVGEAAASAPDHPALVFHDQVTTWSELDARVNAVARGLRGLGLQVGDRVALQLGNTPDFPTAYFGALRAGLVALPLNPSYTTAELTQVLTDSGASAIITAPATVGVVLDVPGRPEHVVVAGGRVEGQRALEDLMTDRSPYPSEAGGEDLAVLIYTSGTSGRPRGAMLTHRALLANLEQTSGTDPAVVTADDVVLMVLPLFHIYGLNGVLGLVAKHAATGVLVERFDPVTTLEEVRRHRVTNIAGAPPMWIAWSLLPELSTAFASVRIAMSGAAPLPVPVLHRVQDLTRLPVYEGYGLTETAPGLSSTVMSGQPKPGSIGRAFPGVELRLVDESGAPVEEDDPGEILARGPNLFSGYWPDGVDGPNEQGWFATGDIAVMDEDGDLRLVDRRKELILVSGFNVYPREVEDVIAAHPQVAEVAVLGVPHPYTGESVKALVVLKPGASLTAEDVIAHAARSLARFKCPTVVEFVDSLPYTATGKVSKGQLREASP